MTKTEWQIPTDTLIEVFLTQHLAEGQAEVHHYLSDDSDTSSDGSDLDQEMNDWDEVLQPLSQALIEAAHLASLYMLP
jgi:hypothetical protein